CLSERGAVATRSQPEQTTGRYCYVLVRTGSGSDPVSTGANNPVVIARGSDAARLIATISLS
ncbi:MAG: hypothetical protein M3410_09555, partial [Acidobacteriota bacterium]|nr:hypothetical protein [Acidobacteriota bacterium]